jgi:glucose-1-phosphate cytidylyltransferase
MASKLAEARRLPSVKVVVLRGGLGTRLGEETEWHIMKSYARYGFREFVLCLGYKGSIIKDYFLNNGR